MGVFDGLFRPCVDLYCVPQGRELPLDPKTEASEDRTFSTEARSQVLSTVDKAYAELVSCQDPLERQNEQLREFRRRLRSILTSVSDVMLVLRRSGAIEEVSVSVEHITGIDRSALVGRKSDGPFDAECADMLRQAVHALRFSKRPVRFESDVKTQAGRAHPFEGVPQADEELGAEGYGWCKAPWLGGASCEAGALARQIVDGLPLALVGAPVAEGENAPLSVQHVVRSFDPCLVCAVH